MPRTKTNRSATTKPDRLKQAHERLTEAVESIASRRRLAAELVPPSVDSLHSLYLAG